MQVRFVRSGTRVSRLLVFYFFASCIEERYFAVSLHEILFGFKIRKESDMSDVRASGQHIGSKENVVWGWLFMVFGGIFFLGFLYAAVLSKLLPPSGNQIISAIQNDRYYCFLVPITLPVLVVAVYFHWLSMKLFKHA